MVFSFSSGFRPALSLQIPSLEGLEAPSWSGPRWQAQLSRAPACLAVLHHEGAKVSMGSTSISPKEGTREDRGSVSRRVFVDSAACAGTVRMLSSLRSEASVSPPTQAAGTGKSGIAQQAGGNVGAASFGPELVADLRAGVRVMRYKRTLGTGSYKEVWEVTIDDAPFALSTQRFSNANIKRRKASAVNARSELEMVEALQALPTGRTMFEENLFWWAQSSSMQAYEVGGQLVPAANTERVIPNGGNKSTFLYVLKPLYECDLRALQKRTAPESHPEGWEAMGSIQNTEVAALTLMVDMIEEGAVLHAQNVIHADIKPKNVMIQQGRALLIDFGYSRVVKPAKCQGIIRGEPEYVLASDVKAIRTCRSGDVYAMGKTIFETLFVYDAPFHEAQSFNPGLIEVLNGHLRHAIAAEPSRPVPRFNMSTGTQDKVLDIINSMCRPNNVTFAEAFDMCKAEFPSVVGSRVLQA